MIDLIMYFSITVLLIIVSLVITNKIILHKIEINKRRRVMRLFSIACDVAIHKFALDVTNIQAMSKNKLDITFIKYKPEE